MPSDSPLPARYEIRTLGPEHVEWAKAIMTHSNAFGSAVWSVLWPGEMTAISYKVFETADHMIEHQIASGYSLGLFDTEYRYKRPASATTSGKLWWNTTDLGADGDKLLEQMDFPLLLHSVGALPGFAESIHALEQLDRRDPAAWQPTAPGQLLLRNATATKLDEGGKGLMKHLAHCLMRRAPAAGFRASRSRGTTKP
ncbi:hypothetical protein PG994_000725 [Apiospora phragmitis]|uniref:Uncharacterized protein n=1 Tax=Apiospora phragmitis TaxID=2905665 RepID=A0ABR1X717_9PEZI